MLTDQFPTLPNTSFFKNNSCTLSITRPSKKQNAYNCHCYHNFMLQNYVQCIPFIKPTVLSNENWPYKWDGLITDLYGTWPQLGLNIFLGWPLIRGPYKRDALYCYQSDCLLLLV